MIGFSLLQLVTSESEAVDILNAQPMQSLPCSSHVLATQHSIASVCPTPTRHDLPPIIIVIHPWDVVKIPPLFRHVMNASTDPFVPFAFFLPIMCVALVTMH
jgi:hypothetical protein